MTQHLQDGLLFGSEYPFATNHNGRRTTTCGTPGWVDHWIHKAHFGETANAWRWDTAELIWEFLAETPNGEVDRHELAFRLVIDRTKPELLAWLNADDRREDLVDEVLRDWTETIPPTLYGALFLAQLNTVRDMIDLMFTLAEQAGVYQPTPITTK